MPSQSEALKIFFLGASDMENHEGLMAHALGKARGPLTTD